ncbi:protein PET100 homolog, mitochondrial [Macrosteles quadrilineatus]|uniref:protein PET100 homolog, mitochondrial n=1 Tax=Macrosteles quadrilineatus TaxID=74068 RepID=UPI0023E0BD01|nr:protein PET100 homolog, mitochondrial [Macrosteles quadrilineatus]XP_054269160.1 protein PET100 homolog, mitochondrial [Macrosteles quadrilineatus]
MGWKMEVGKMMLYMAFPLATFHYFNQPQFYEEWVVKTKRELYPPESEEVNEKIRAQLLELRRERELIELKKKEAQLK